MHRTEGANAIIDSAGHRVFTEELPPTTITAAWLNSIQEEIATVVENAGIGLKTADNDTRDQLWQALLSLGRPYDYIVTSNNTFLEVIERVAANQYRFKSDYKSLFFAQVTGGYSMNYVLQGGDTWGYIETNATVNITFESGAYINMGNERGYIEINTEGCLLDSVSIRGNGLLVPGVSGRSFLLNADNITLRKCDTQDRYFGVIFWAFEGQTGSVSETTTLDSCRVVGCDANTTWYGFYYINNINNSIIRDCTINGNAACIYFCKNINNVYIKNITASNAISGISNCENCNNIIYENITSTGGFNYGVDKSKNINNLKIIQIDGASGCYGFYDSTQLTNCYAEDIDSSGGNAYGFFNVSQISLCRADDCHTGFFDCDFLTNCNASNNDNNGYNSCLHISASIAFQNGGFGFVNTDFITNSRASTNGSDGYNNCDTLTNNFANSNTGDGYQDCNHMEHNRASGNGGVAYNNCFADLAGTRAVASSDSGGDNA